MRGHQQRQQYKGMRDRARVAVDAAQAAQMAEEERKKLQELRKQATDKERARKAKEDEERKVREDKAKEEAARLQAKREEQERARKRGEEARRRVAEEKRKQTEAADARKKALRQVCRLPLKRGMTGREKECRKKKTHKQYRCSPLQGTPSAAVAAASLDDDEDPESARQREAVLERKRSRGSLVHMVFTKKNDNPEKNVHVLCCRLSLSLISSFFFFGAGTTAQVQCAPGHAGGVEDPAGLAALQVPEGAP